MLELKKVSQKEKAWIETMINDGRSVYEEMFGVIHHLRRVRALRVKAKTPRSFGKIMGSGIRAPMSWSHVQTVVGMLAKNRPTFTRLPRRRKEAKAAQRLANSCSPTLDALERDARKPIYYLFADQLAGDGRGIIKLRVLPWEGYPIQEEEEKDTVYNRRVDEWLASVSATPFRAGLVDPLNFMPSREEWDAPYVIEQGWRNTNLTLNRLNLAFGTNNQLVTAKELPRGKANVERELPRGVGPTMPVEEIWFEDEFYVRIHNEEIFKAPNEMGLIPYVYRYGEMTSIPDPSLEGVSSIFPFIGIEPWLNTILSVMAAWSILGATPILWTSRDASATGAIPNRMPVSDIPLGKRVDLGPGGKIGFVSPPEVGRSVIEYANLLLSIYEKAGMTPLARGLIGTRTPGLTLSAALEAASDRLKPVQWNLETGVAELMQKVWHIVADVVKSPVYVTGEGFMERPMGLGRKKQYGRFIIDPADIDDYYELKAEVKLSNLQDIISQGMHSAFMVAHKIWSKERGMKFANVDDPFDENLQILREEFRNDPRVRELLMQMAVSEEPEMQKLFQAVQTMGGETAGTIQSLEDEGVGSEQGEEDIFGGAPQPRGGPSPGAGGAPAGRPRRPTGPGPAGTRQGQLFP